MKNKNIPYWKIVEQAFSLFSVIEKEANSAL